MEDQKTFWSLSPENGKLSPEILDLYEFLKDRGYRKRTIADEIETYKQNGHFVSQCFTSDQINEVTYYLEKEVKKNASIHIEYERKADQTYTYTPREILEKLVKYGWGKIFNENNFNHLPELSVTIKRHTNKSAFFYFRNGYVEVTREGAKLHPYSSIDGQYIYKDYLIDRDIELVDVNDQVIQDFAPRGYNFFDFLNRLAGVPLNADEATQEHAEKLRYLMECIGFLLHDYKQQGLTDFGIILCDDNVGGTGKGLIIQALRQLTKVAEIDAKKEDKYDPEELTERTRIKVYNDVEPSFNFKMAYNEITDQAVVRPMYKTPRYIPYKDSWKVVFTSNHIIRGNSGADNRRQRVFSVNPFFNEHKTVRDHYEHSFFSEDWKQNDWNYFFSLMFECTRFWLDTNYKLSFNDPDYIERRMEEEYPFEFREYVGALVDKVRNEGSQHVKVSELLYTFKGNDKYKLSAFVRKLEVKFFSRLLRKYLDNTPGISYQRNHNRTELSIFEKKK